MAPAMKTDKKPRRRDKRRTRTEDISSSSSSEDLSSSSSDEEVEATTAPPPAKKKAKKSHTANAESNITKNPEQDLPTASPSSSSSVSSSSDPSSDDEPVPTATAKPEQPELKFNEEMYLKQATREFANDLDKLRAASDWRGDGSLDVLIRALGQGAGMVR